MAGVLEDQRGGITGLFTLSDELWQAFEADLARSGWSIDDVPQRLSWVAVNAMLFHSQPGDARYSVLLELSEQAQRTEMADDIKNTIASAQRMGWG